jgi:hypothetical protein
MSSEPFCRSIVKEGWGWLIFNEAECELTSMSPFTECTSSLPVIIANHPNTL